jgi:chemotaxis signal transduction protein
MYYFKGLLCAVQELLEQILYTSSPSYAQIVQGLIKHRGNFTVYHAY